MIIIMLIYKYTWNLFVNDELSIKSQITSVQATNLYYSLRRIAKPVGHILIPHTIALVAKQEPLFCSCLFVGEMEFVPLCLHFWEEFTEWRSGRFIDKKEAFINDKNIDCATQKTKNKFHTF